MTNTRFPIPESVQRDFRDRLRRLREGSSLTKTELTTTANISASTLQNYENHDLSTMPVGFLYKLAEAYNVNFVDLLSYVFSGTTDDRDLERRANANDDQRFVTMIMAQLPSDLQRLLRDQADALANYAVTATATPKPRSLARHNTREMLQRVANAS